MAYYQTPQQREAAYRAIGQVPPPTTSIRDVQLQGGSPGAFLDLGNRQAQGVAQSVPSGGYQNFNQAILGLLQRYQQLGTKPFVEQGLNAQREQTNRISAQTPSNLIGASPALQESVRSGQAGALQPTIQGAQQGAQTFKEQLSAFGNAIDAAKSFVATQEASQNKSRDDARSLIKDSFSMFGGSAFDKISPEEATALEKSAGLPKGYILGVGDTIKERELEQKRQANALTGGLNASQINTTVNQIRGAFDNEQIVKEYNQILGQIQFARTASKTPTDDISRIYVFAKVMDPNSVVREGEYATVQKYATSLLQRYGLQTKRVFTNSGFLTDEARKFLLNTLERKLKVSQSQYDNVAREYQRQIDDVRAGRPPQITQYSNVSGGKDEWEYVPDTKSTSNTITRPPIRFGQ